MVSSLTNNLRPYQISGFNDILSSFRSGQRGIILHLDTGTGKTVIFTTLMRHVSEAGKTSMMLVRGRKLVKQASERLTREHTPHHVMMAGADPLLEGSNVIVASIDTLLSRGFLPNVTFLVIDEADLAATGGFKQVIEHYAAAGACILGVTATPHSKKGLKHIASIIIRPINFKESVNQGYLSPIRAFRPELAYVMTKGMSISKTTNEYNTSELYEATEKQGISGSIPDRYAKYIPGSRSLLFAVSINHSKRITDNLNSAGIPSLHVDASTSDRNREKAIESLARGDIKVICNVGIFCRGVDLPWLEAIIMARKLASYNLHNQQIGRVTRVFPGKSEGIVLDLVGNTLEHDLPEFERPVYLDPKDRVSDSYISKTKTCEKCYAVYGKHIKVCPVCGYEKPKEEMESKREKENRNDKSLNRFKPGDSIPIRLKKLKHRAKKNGYKSAWAYYQLLDTYGIDATERHLPIWFIKHYKKTQLKQGE